MSIVFFFFLFYIIILTSCRFFWTICVYTMRLWFFIWWTPFFNIDTLYDYIWVYLVHQPTFHGTPVLTSSSISTFARLLKKRIKINTFFGKNQYKDRLPLQWFRRNRNCRVPLSLVASYQAVLFNEKKYL